MISYHECDVFKAKDLPLKYAAISPCLRKEAGSYGKDTKGLYRVHEFMKVEQIVFCRADQEESDKLFEELSKNAEEVLKDLGLPYRVCLMPWVTWENRSTKNTISKPGCRVVRVMAR